jgi:hypothetical protein
LTTSKTPIATWHGTASVGSSPPPQAQKSFPGYRGGVLIRAARPRAARPHSARISRNLAPTGGLLVSRGGHFSRAPKLTLPLGAKVKAEPATTTEPRPSAIGYASSVLAPLNFGPGALTVIPSIQINHPNGQSKTLTNAPANRILVPRPSPPSTRSAPAWTPTSSSSPTAQPAKPPPSTPPSA